MTICFLPFTEPAEHVKEIEERIHAAGEAIEQAALESPTPGGADVFNFHADFSEGILLVFSKQGCVATHKKAGIKFTMAVTG